eukprot:gene28479-32165_t
MAAADSSIRALLGPHAVAPSKDESGRALDWIGWSIDLDTRLVSLSHRNYLRTVYAFFFVDVTAPISLNHVQRMASLAFATVRSPFARTTDSRYQNTYEYLAVVLGLLLVHRAGIRCCAYSLHGDSVSSLQWASQDRAASTLARRANIAFTTIACEVDALVADTVHVPGVANTVYDGLSRGLSAQSSAPNSTFHPAHALPSDFVFTDCLSVKIVFLSAKNISLRSSQSVWFSTDTDARLQLPRILFDWAKNANLHSTDHFVSYRTTPVDVTNPLSYARLRKVLQYTARLFGLDPTRRAVYWRTL